MILRFFIGALALFSWSHTISAAPTSTQLKADFIQKMISEHGFSEAEVNANLAKATKNQAVLDAIVRPWEAKPWYKYRPIFLTDKRLKAGLKFWQQHKATLDRAEQELGVNAEIIVAIIGVETFYGTYLGKYPVLDSLYSLGFYYPKRGKFFRSELAQLMLMAKEEKFAIESIKGSYAGALGWGQFIPSSYRHYSIDFDNDGVRDLLTNPVDAIGSVGNYFKRHKWQYNGDVAFPAHVNGADYRSILSKKSKPKQKIADILAKGVSVDADVNMQVKGRLLELEIESGHEHWLTLHNFYVITRYNHSPLYAMAVYQFSQQLKAAMNEVK